MKVGFGLGISYPQGAATGIVAEPIPIGDYLLLWGNGENVLWGDNSTIPITSKDNLLWLNGTDALWNDGTDILYESEN